MAELVHLHLEQGLTELEEMERVGLFNKNEIRKLIKRRKVFEYRLRRNAKTKDDYLKYIEFETKLLLLITKRRERLLCDSKKKEIDNSIAKKINKLFKAAVARYPEDKKLWLSQIEFLKQMKWNHSINALYTRLLQFHSKSPKLYILAAQWEMDDNHSFDNARNIFLRGIAVNPKSENIWRAYYRMELKYVETIRKRREVLQLQNIKDESPENDAVMAGSISNVVYSKAIKEIPDVEFALSFIQIGLEFDFTTLNIEYILDDVATRFPDREETLDALAKRPLLNIDKLIEEGKRTGTKKTVIKKIYEEIYSKYDEAVQSLPTEKMWNYYFEFLFSLLQSAKENNKIKLQANILRKMEDAANADCLPLGYYEQWIELLFKKGEEKYALTISLSAARKWNTVTLWLKCLTFHIRCLASSTDIYLLIMEALNSLDEKESYPIWNLGVEWLSISDPEKLIKFFEKGIDKCKEVSLPLKQMYLETISIKDGLPAARDLYKKFKKMGPLSIRLIRTMILLEKAQLKPSVENIKKYFEDGIRAFGSTDVDLWIEYMHFENQHNEGNPSMYGMVYWRAKKTLEPHLLKDLETRVTEYSTGCGLSSHGIFLKSPS